MMPDPNQPVRVRLIYTKNRVVERWITVKNIDTYFRDVLARYPIRQPSPHETTPRRFIRHRFTIMEITWEGKEVV